MTKDRSWMNWKTFGCRKKPEYINGVKDFVEYAFANAAKEGKIRCPCVNCDNYNHQNKKTVLLHLLHDGIQRNYTLWEFHGEKSLQEEHNVHYDDSITDEGEHIVDEDVDETFSMLHDMTNSRAFNVINEFERLGGSGISETPELLEKFSRLVRDAEKELFPGCEKFSKLEFMVHLLHIKCLCGWSDKSLTMMLELLKKAFDFDDTFPKNAYEAKKYTRELGLSYVKIEACKNDCILYWKENEKDEKCPRCHHPRWKDKNEECDDSDDEGENRGKGKNIPYKVLRYFPLIPRLQRLFISSKTSSHMRWHKDKRPDDGILRHPADAEAWKKFDASFPHFAADARNVRLGLCTDGFTPYSNINSTYSMWPVFLVPYNLPPWMCMKKPYTMLNMIIPGKTAPGTDIDVYLQPLIDELKTLWEVGINTYDASRSEYFTLRASLLCTINDFPAYGNLSGWSVKGRLACPVCNKETWSQYLPHWRKLCYMGHRRFLERDHKWRFDKKSFDNTVENDPPPKQLSGDDIQEQIANFENVKFGKVDGKRKRTKPKLVYNWDKKSIFFELPYWSKNLVRHNLDVMHIEKNICESILGTLMNIPGKTKDNLKSRLDLVEMGIKKNLHPKKVGDKYAIPKATFELSPSERKDVCRFLADLKVPDGYSSNIGRCVNVIEGKITGTLKSHDCHIFMQDLLAPSFRGKLEKEVYEPLVELSLYFKYLCSKTLKVDVLERLEKSIAITLCKLERVFVPSFFDIMVHLTIHLATEAKLAGPVHYRWMYPFERLMHTLKEWVRNKARPEGAIAEAYIADECLTFCSRYLHRAETRFNRLERNEDGGEIQNHGISIFKKTGKSLGKGYVDVLSYKDCERAHLYVIRNCEEAQPFIEEYERIGASPKPNFTTWFEDRITHLWNERDKRASYDLLVLAQQPMKRTTCYDGYVVNGYRFHTKERARNLATQNSGVVVKGDIQSGEKDYFGVLNKVIELEYDNKHKIVLFLCEWYDVYNENVGIKREAYGVTSINSKSLLKTNEPYVLASQVEQVYYMRDNMNANWRLVVKTNPRNFYDVPCDDEDEETESFMSVDEAIGEAYIPIVNDGTSSLVRDDINPQVVDANIVAQELQRRKKKGKMQVANEGSESESTDEEDMPLFGDETDNE